MHLLMHLCCANCALYPVSKLRKDGHTVHGLWFNPNIHPLVEYRNRLGALEQLAALWNLPIEYRGEYGMVEFVRAVA
ncbi:MAG: epoxyqueuosine reductase QueH, partial [Nitrospiraceae bacterium]|nr:epoxyqueuosine reductase QueH [Nitrospiraceae bacterium]